MVEAAMTALLAVLLTWAPSPAQSALERSPNMEGIWSARTGTVHFHFMHRFQVTDPPLSKVLNSPTFLVATGLPGRLTAGARYASNSVLVSGEPNEWEAFGRWVALDADRTPVDLLVQAGWNGTAESVDGEVVVGRDLGPVRLMVAGRAFSAFAGGDGEVAAVGGARVRLHRFVALSGDVARLMGSSPPDAAWSAGLQLEIPYTPHSLSLHVSNANTTTLQGSSVGLTERLWGFEFTVPVTLSRYFGSSPPAAAAASSSTAAAGASAGSGEAAEVGGVVVEMDNRLRYLPDTVRVAAGEAVTWRNTSDIVHTVTADPSRAAEEGNVALPGGADPFDSGDMVPGAEFVHRFTVPGEYRYICVPHELAGMVGVVIVE